VIEMTKSEAKKIAANKIWGTLDYLYPLFETMFDEIHGDGYSEQEQEIILEQANKIAERLIKIVKPIAMK